MDVTVARALHVLGVVHWIGGLAMVTLVILPPAARLADPTDRLALFVTVERRFGAQARWSVTLVGLTGFWMTWRLDAWWRFAEPGYWWMDAMLALWALFTVLLFVAEPLVLHARLGARGVDVRVQSTTRSPILLWGAVGHILTVPDPYGEGVQNYLYNVRPGQYARVLICHETAPSDQLIALATTLRARLIHFTSDDHVEEIPVC